MKSHKESDERRIEYKKKTLRRAAGFFFGIAKTFLSIPAFVGKRIGMEDLACNLLMPFSEAVEKKSNCYVTYNLVPQYAKDQNNWFYYSSEISKECCIVVQGPIAKENDFTLETVRYYGKIYPDMLVIVSTWENEDKEYLEKFKKESNCKVLLNKIPEKSGNGNVNYQIVSSLGGAKKAASCDKKYVLKTRSDMRITASGALDMLCNYINQFDVARGVKERQNQRLIFFNAFLFHPYHASDFFCFGTTQDIIEYYDIELNELESIGNAANKMIANQWSYRDLYNNPCGENEICIKYFKKINGTTTCELQEWWRVLAEHLIALPLSFLKPIWIKYDYNHEESNFYMTYRRSMLGGDGIDNTRVEFGMWLDMYHDKFTLNSNEYEYILDSPMS